MKVIVFKAVLIAAWVGFGIAAFGLSNARFCNHYGKIGVPTTRLEYAGMLGAAIVFGPISAFADIIFLLDVNDGNIFRYGWTLRRVPRREP